jgi:acyl dehydratase
MRCTGERPDEEKTMNLTRLARGRYKTPTGYVIESDNASIAEYDEVSDPEWFVYDPETAARGDYGPPEALADGFSTRRAAVDYLTQLLGR